MANISSRTPLTLISDTDKDLIVNVIFISSAIALFGVVANVMNMVVFYKQGFTSTMNISFFGLAISDLCGLLALIWCIILFNPFFDKSDLPVVGQEIFYLTGGLPSVYFGRITAWITVYITAERCLCIMVPLKVKGIVTPTRTTIILCLIYTGMILVFLPEYATSYIDWKWYPAKNVTLLGMAFTDSRSSVEGLSYIFYSFIGATSFISVVVLTVVLVYQLEQKSKWRVTANTDKAKQELLSNRERKAVTMVVMIATVLIVCYTPGAAVSMATFLAPDFGITGINVNAFFVSWSFLYICDAINSSINIFLYYKMSSKYRETFNEIFALLCACATLPMPETLGRSLSQATCPDHDISCIMFVAPSP